MVTRYRIVKFHAYCEGQYRYCLQKWRWYCPVWDYFGSTYSTEDEAKEALANFKWRSNRKVEVVYND